MIDYTLLILAFYSLALLIATSGAILEHNGKIVQPRKSEIQTQDHNSSNADYNQTSNSTDGGKCIGYTCQEVSRILGEQLVNIESTTKYIILLSFPWTYSAPK